MGTISMSRKERKRLEAFSRVKTGGMTLVEASELLRLSYRQTKRAWSRYQSEGDAGLVHRLRGRAPNRHSPEKTKQRSLALYRERYADYGATLAAECLEKEDGVKVSVTTLRRWLLQAGLLDRRRKRRLHRRRRTRREHLGELVQMDGSFHDWFEGRRGWAVLMVMIDDATGRVTARFYEKESWASSSDLFQRYARRHGLPRGLYVDQHSIYRPEGEPTDAELLDNCPPETQFGRAMRELDVELDSGAESASEGACGAYERNASGSAGQGVAAREDLRLGVGEPIPGGDVSGGIQRALRGGGGGGGGLASPAIGRHGPGAHRVDSRIAGGGQGLDIALAESHLAIAA